MRIAKVGHFASSFSLGSAHRLQLGSFRPALSPPRNGCGRLADREFNVFVLLADGELPGRQRRSQRR
jgi:hypothetical protein